MTKRKTRRIALKKEDKSSKEATHSGAIVEDIEAKLDIIIESQQGFQRQLNYADKNLEDFREEVNLKFEVVFEKFDEVDKKFEIAAIEVANRFDGVETRLARLESHSVKS
jgi:hypothetical protein